MCVEGWIGGVDIRFIEDGASGVIIPMLGGFAVGELKLLKEFVGLNAEG